MKTYTLPQKTVSDIMTKKVCTVEATDTIESLVKKFKKHDFHSFPVLSKGRLSGIVTKTDLLNCIDDKRLSNIAVKRVEDIMTPHPITISTEDGLDQAAHAMRKNRIRILPVVDEGKLVGLLSYSDLTKIVFKD
jgi:CBS domain-containing protein